MYLEELSYHLIFQIPKNWLYFVKVATGLDEDIALIAQFQQEFGHKKAEHLVISDKTFGNVPIPGQL